MYSLTLLELHTNKSYYEKNGGCVIGCVWSHLPQCIPPCIPTLRQCE